MKAWKFSTVFPLHNDRSKVEGVATQTDNADSEKPTSIVGPFGLKLFTDLRLVSATAYLWSSLQLVATCLVNSSCRVWNFGLMGIDFHVLTHG